MNLDGLRSKSITTWGKTSCSQWFAQSWKRVVPVPYWTYIDYPDTLIGFDEQTRYASATLIIQNTTVRNPVRVDGVDYDCVILGDGQYHHFGLNFPGRLPATIELKCDNLTVPAAARPLPHAARPLLSTAAPTALLTEAH
jgi:hypothetical protein